MIGIIAAVSENGVIGKDNKLPFDYPEDMKFFREMTARKDDADSIVIMGWNTFTSMDSKPLPNRRNIVISQSKVGQGIKGVEVWPSISLAISEVGFEEADIWFIGGSNIYREGMQYAYKIYLTLIPEIVKGDNLAYFPWIDPTKFEISGVTRLLNAKGEKTLSVAKYTRMKTA